MSGRTLIINANLLTLAEPADRGNPIRKFVDSVYTLRLEAHATQLAAHGVVPALRREGNT